MNEADTHLLSRIHAIADEIFLIGSCAISRLLRCDSGDRLRCAAAFAAGDSVVTMDTYSTYHLALGQELQRVVAAPVYGRIQQLSYVLLAMCRSPLT